MIDTNNRFTNYQREKDLILHRIVRHSSYRFWSGSICAVVWWLWLFIEAQYHPPVQTWAYYKWMPNIAMVLAIGVVILHFPFVRDVLFKSNRFIKFHHSVILLFTYPWALFVILSNKIENSLNQEIWGSLMTGFLISVIQYNEHEKFRITGRSVYRFLKIIILNIYWFLSGTFYKIFK